METHARPPAPLRKDGDMASNWQNWKEEFLIFMKVTNYMERESTDKRACRLKNLIGTIGIEAIRNITFDNEQDKDNMDILIEKLDKYFIPTKKEVVERHQFFRISKKQNDSIEHHITLLREKAKNCNFKDLTDSIIRDKIILDTHDKILRQKFLEADDLNLPKLIAIYNDYTNTEKRKQFTQLSCSKCGTKHPINQCPAQGSKCKDCNELHRSTGRCPDLKKNKKSNDKAKKNVFDETQKSTPKNNDKWNIQADSAIKKDLITFPDVPTICDENASGDKDSTFNFPKNKHDLQFWNDKTMTHSANLPKKTEESCSYKKFPVKPDETHTTRLKLQNDTMHQSANLPKKTEDDCSYKKFPVNSNETHITNLKLQNDTMNHSSNLPEKTEDSHSHKNFAVKPDETHANSKSRTDNTTSHSTNLFKSTLKPDETHNTISRSWYDNAMNHSTNSSKNTQNSHSYKNFTAKPDGTHNTSSKSWSDNTTHSAYSPNTQHGRLQFAQHTVTSDGWTISSKNENIQKKKADKDCVVS
ncbi:GATA zinc finger domain-containing protein 14 isoform X2 [Monomorium pharaonis]|uniref:GATA zinc finger domain-containing protein 14 isoform X2 n=1 Tax=Monomorium pharaonis TaxID=307658 RepID=UPI001745E4D1|nr:GATA zinc finger domain-containing protein 14 isoform X2 [Monomorium pharaonis]